MQAQTYPCKHYIFVNGEQCYKQASEIIQKFDNLTVIYLPTNLGNADELISMLVKEDMILYLKDDECFEPNHIELRIKEIFNF